jgi:threonine dehydrogenase-like Zn-dependent dehydrogenase
MKTTIISAVEGSNMRSVTCEEREKPVIEQPTDGILRVVRACVCGSDLWTYRGYDTPSTSGKIGHEAIGIIDSVGPDVRNFKPGDFVVIPFTYSDGTCVQCERGISGACVNGGFYDGCQAEYVRVPLLDGTAYAIERGPLGYDLAAQYNGDADLLASLTACSDVMATGYHAGKLARVSTGDTVAIIGDGAVGLCAVIGAKMQGAERIIVLSHHGDRAQMARDFGATDIVSARDDDAVAAVLEMTGGVGVTSVLECVGNGPAMDIALKICAPLGLVGSVGVPHGVELDPRFFFNHNVGLAIGRASARSYMPILVPAVLRREINPGRVFTLTTDLDHVAEAYEAMDQRTAIKSLLKVSEI